MEFVFKQQVLFKHCDPAGIVFYPRYFEMLNDCVEAFFDHLGHPFHEMHPDHGTPTARINTTFQAPSRHGDYLEFTLRCQKVGRSSLDIEINATCEKSIRLRMESTLVFVNKDGKPTSWPDDLRQKLIPYQKGEKHEQ